MGKPVQDVTTRWNSDFNRLQCLLRNIQLQDSAPPGLDALHINLGHKAGSGVALKRRAWAAHQVGGLRECQKQGEFKDFPFSVVPSKVILQGAVPGLIWVRREYGT